MIIVIIFFEQNVNTLFRAKLVWISNDLENKNTFHLYILEVIYCDLSRYALSNGMFKISGININFRDIWGLKRQNRPFPESPFSKQKLEIKKTRLAGLFG